MAWTRFYCYGKRGIYNWELLGDEENGDRNTSCNSFDEETYRPRVITV